MRFCAARFAFLLTLIAVSGGVTHATEVQDDYELTMSVASQATAGWDLLLTQVPEDQQHHGRYIDTDPATPAKDFWSNGVWAKLDRDGEGHHETIFVVRDNKLIYFGSVGSKGTFVDVSQEFQDYQGKSITKFQQDIHQWQKMSKAIERS